jgi:hypothetical protein
MTGHGSSANTKRYESPLGKGSTRYCFHAVRCADCVFVWRAKHGSANSDGRAGAAGGSALVTLP